MKYDIFYLCEKQDKSVSIGLSQEKADKTMFVDLIR